MPTIEVHRQADPAIKWLCPDSDSLRLIQPLVPFGEPPKGSEPVKHTRSRLVLRYQLADGRPVYIKRYLVKT